MNENIQRTKYLIIGAGLAGLSTAYFLNDEYRIVESESLPGGTAGTLKYGNFRLDNAAHILYFKNNFVKQWIVDTLQINLNETIRNGAVWIDSRFVNFPIQYHLSRLPIHSRISSLASICKSIFSQNEISPFNNFYEYSLSAFGKYLTNKFVKPYNEKLFNGKLVEMTIDWMGEYVPDYSKLQMILSAFGFTNRNYGRNFKFYYPAEGGISIVADRICSQLKIPPLFSYTLNRVDLNSKTAFFENGKIIKYDYLVNTISLRKLLEIVDPLHKNILASSSSLKISSTTILHILIKGKVNHRGYHWIYIPEKTIPFYRISFPGNINPANCPNEYSVITLEFGGNLYENSEVVNQSKLALRQIGILQNERLDYELKWKLLDCGYVIYDMQRQKTLKEISPFLISNKIFSIGRYGSWEYSNMESAIMQGKKLAEFLNGVN
jgi:protoporphyrinogen oxidase